MPTIFIMAHAPLASSLLAVAAHAFPDKTAGLVALDVQPDHSVAQVQQEVQRLLGPFGSSEILILTDVLGATPCNVARGLLDGVRVKMLAGVNVPMLWRSLCYLHEPLHKLYERALAGGVQGVVPVMPADESILSSCSSLKL